LAEDEKMVDAYDTGDVYLQFGKDSGMIPKDATKESHPVERQKCKTTVLGISYLMSKVGLAAQLNCDEEDAQDLIYSFEDTYCKLTEYRDKIQEDYIIDGRIKLPDGWSMFSDNANERSIGNAPIQGFGSCILRKAIQLCQDAGLKVILPLHDALYIEVDTHDWNSVELFQKCMIDAFTFYFKGIQKDYAESIMIDIEAWSEELEEGKILVGGLEVSCERTHIDSRSREEYDKFSKYFSQPCWELL